MPATKNTATSVNSSKNDPPADIRDLSLEELAAYLKSVDAEPFRAEQIFQWIYQKGAWGFEAMTNIPAGLRDRLKKDFILKPNEIAQKLSPRTAPLNFFLICMTMKRSRAC
jgi:adenine C2-methylase RlmN of 23S rRNA A2503 and tRNA A37